MINFLGKTTTNNNSFEPWPVQVLVAANFSGVTAQGASEYSPIGALKIGYRSPAYGTHSIFVNLPNFYTALDNYKEYQTTLSEAIANKTRNQTMRAYFQTDSGRNVKNIMLLMQIVSRFCQLTGTDSEPYLNLDLEDEGKLANYMDPQYWVDLITALAPTEEVFLYFHTNGKGKVILYSYNMSIDGFEYETVPAIFSQGATITSTEQKSLSNSNNRFLSVTIKDGESTLRLGHTLYA